MNIKDFAATTAAPSFRGLEVEKGVQRLILKKDGAWANETLTMSVVRDGKKIADICVNHEISHLNAFAGFGTTNGVYQDSVLTATNAFAVIEVAPFTFPFDNKTKLVIDFNNGVNLKNYRVYSQATGTSQGLLCKYDRNTITSGQTSKTIDVSDNQMLSIDNTTITQITLMGDNGVSNQITNEEWTVLDRLNKDFGYVGYGAAGVLTATEDNIIMTAVQDISQATIECTGASAVVYTQLTFVTI